MQKELRFPAETYTTESWCVDGIPFACRAWKGLRYCTSPVDDVQRLDLYAPACYFEGGSINGYDAENAPIFLPNRVGGYMPGWPGAPELDEQGRPNTVLSALMHGYVVACPGIRGRSSGVEQRKPTGKAPALIVDMKAVVRYLRANGEAIPGDPEKMITSGTSAGGALSALTGASGNAAAYESYLQAIGAVEARDDIFAANCYCPIINLENADMAYEWQFSAERAYRSWRHAGELDDGQISVAQALKARFPAYLNSLGLTDEAGNELTLQPDGTGAFLERVKAWLIAAAQHELDTQDSAVRLHGLRVSGSEVEAQSCLTICGGRVTAIDWPAFVHAITRMKTPPAFDALDLSSTENDEFADSHGVPRHFTAFSHAHSAVGGTMAEAETIRLLNPMAQLGQGTPARHWRIRHGSHDRDTSLAIPVIFAETLRMQGCQVDFRMPWGLPHSGDYDLKELFAWIDGLCRNSK